MSKVFKIIRPKSLQDSSFEAYEYLIRWIGRDGSDYLFMFYDAEVQRKTRSEVINSESSTLIESIISREEKNITLFADDLSKSDLQVILQLFGNKFVTRIFKDETTERYAPEQNSFKYRELEGRYEIELTLIAPELKVWS